MKTELLRSRTDKVIGGLPVDHELAAFPLDRLESQL